MANSKSFLSPYEILPKFLRRKFLYGISTAKKNEYFGKLSYFLINLYHRGDSNEYTQHIIIFIENQKDMTKLSPFASCPGTIINPQWLELPVSRIHFHGPKDVWAIEILL